jgi:hypothetical protein
MERLGRYGMGEPMLKIRQAAIIHPFSADFSHSFSDQISMQ